MTIGKGLALTAALVGAVALGVVIGPYTPYPYHDATVTDASGADKAPQIRATDQSTPQSARTPASPRDAKPRTRIAAARRTASSATPRNVPAFAPALHEVLKPILNKGADLTLASRDFVDGEQFATVAHAARNTEVPFMLLKHRVLDEGKSLEEAIRESRPNLNAVAQAKRARAEAKSDIRTLLG